MTRSPLAALSLTVLGLAACAEEPTRPTQGRAPSAEDARTTSATAVPFRVTVRDLGTLPGFPYSLGTGINRFGHVTGTLFNTRGEAHAFIWTPERGMRDLGLVAELTGDLNDLDRVPGTRPTPSGVQHAALWRGAGWLDLSRPPWTSSRATDLNNGRTGVGPMVVGFGSLQLPGGFPERAFRWTHATGMRELGMLPGGSGSQAHAVNSAGQVAGESGVLLAGGDSRVHAVRWSAANVIEDLGTLLGRHFNSSGRGLNDLGHVVGNSDARCGKDVLTHAFRWTPARGMQDLTPRLCGNPAEFSTGLAINDHGLVVGAVNVCDAAGACRQLAVVWTASGAMQELPTLRGGGDLAGAVDVNEHNQVVGSSLTTSGFPRAVLWTLTPR